LVGAVRQRLMEVGEIASAPARACDTASTARRLRMSSTVSPAPSTVWPKRSPAAVINALPRSSASTLYVPTGREPSTRTLLRVACWSTSSQVG